MTTSRLQTFNYQWDNFRNGIDLTRPFHYSSLIESCLHDYRRGYGRGRS
jgi:hypothetical protein